MTNPLDIRRPIGRSVAAFQPASLPLRPPLRPSFVFYESPLLLLPRNHLGSGGVSAFIKSSNGFFYTSLMNQKQILVLNQIICMALTTL